MNKKYILIALTAVFLGTSVYVAIESSASGAEARLLAKEESVLQSQKSELESALVVGISVTEIENKSLTLGFVKPTELMYLGGNESKDQALTNSIFH